MWTVTLVRRAPHSNIVGQYKDEVDAFEIAHLIGKAFRSDPEICPSNKAIMIPDEPNQPGTPNHLRAVEEGKKRGWTPPSETPAMIA